MKGSISVLAVRYSLNIFSLWKEYTRNWNIFHFPTFYGEISTSHTKATLQNQMHYTLGQGRGKLVKVFHNAEAVMQTSWDTVRLIKDKAASWKMKIPLIIANTRFSQVSKSLDPRNRQMSLQKTGQLYWYQHGVLFPSPNGPHTTSYCCQQVLWT